MLRQTSLYSECYSTSSLDEVGRTLGGSKVKLGWAIAMLLGLASLMSAKTLVAQAKIVGVDARGFDLRVGTETLRAEDGVKCRFWRNYGRSDRAAFASGDEVVVRLDIGSDPADLREMAEAKTGEWLAQIRSKPQECVVEKIENGDMAVVLAEGRKFTYRVSDKSEIQLRGRTDAKLHHLEKGAKVWVKGRLLPTLDTWVVLISDRPLEDPDEKKPAKKPDAPEKTKPATPALPNSGKLEAKFLACLLTLSMIDVVSGSKTFHITFTRETKFVMQGKSVSPNQVPKGTDCVITYKRDSQGRIIASKVEFFPPRGIETEHGTFNRRLY